MQKEITEAYDKKYPPHSGTESLAGSEKYMAPKATATAMTLQEFLRLGSFASARCRGCGLCYRAAGAALLSNLSIERGAVINWNPDEMRLGREVGGAKLPTLRPSKSVVNFDSVLA